MKNPWVLAAICFWLQIVHVEGSTNRLAIYLLATNVDQRLLIEGTVKAADLKLQPQPIISDSDFLSYDWSNHVFETSAKVGHRVEAALGKATYYDGESLGTYYIRDTPFVMVAMGKPVYAGVIRCPRGPYSAYAASLSSTSKIDYCVPMVGFNGPSSSDTNSTNPFTYSIGRGQFHIPPEWTNFDGIMITEDHDVRTSKRILKARLTDSNCVTTVVIKDYQDVRNDKRILKALKKLGL